MTPTKIENLTRDSLYQTSYKYLLDNFHKFNETNKIKIALTVYKANVDRINLDQSQHTHVTYVWKRSNSRDRLRTPELSGIDTREPSEV